MSCEICGRGACTRSFHSFQDQDDFDNKTGKYSVGDDVDNEVNQKIQNRKG